MIEQLPGLHGLFKAHEKKKREPCYSLREVQELIGCSETWIRTRMPSPDLIGKNRAGDLFLWRRSTVDKLLPKLREEYGTTSKEAA